MSFIKKAILLLVVLTTVYAHGAVNAQEDVSLQGPDLPIGNLEVDKEIHNEGETIKKKFDIGNRDQVIATKYEILEILSNAPKPLFGQSLAYTDQGTSNFTATVGKQPAIHEQGLNSYLQGTVTLQYQTDRITNLPAGVITTFLWHAKHPQSNSYTYKPDYPQANIKSILPGGAYHDEFMVDVHKIGNYLLDLKALGISALFRPFHEMNGDWFWWGTSSVSGNTYQDYIDLFRFFRTHLKGMGVDNILWVFALHVSDSLGSKTEAQINGLYPGDAHVDIIGIDLYREDPSLFLPNLMFLNDFASTRNKLLAMTEYGYPIPPIPSTGTTFHSNWKAFFDDFNFAYVLGWSGEYFIPGDAGTDTEADFVNNVAPHLNWLEDM